MSSSQEIKTTTPVKISNVDLAAIKVVVGRRQRLQIASESKEGLERLSLKVHKCASRGLRNLDRVPELMLTVQAHPSFDKDGKKATEFVESFRKIEDKLKEYASDNSEALFDKKLSYDEVSDMFWSSLSRNNYLNLTIDKHGDKIITNVFDQDANALSNVLDTLDQGQKAVQTAIHFDNLWVNQKKTRFGITLVLDQARVFDDDHVPEEVKLQSLSDIDESSVELVIKSDEDRKRVYMNQGDATTPISFEMEATLRRLTHSRINTRDKSLLISISSEDADKLVSLESTRLARLVAKHSNELVDDKKTIKAVKDALRPLIRYTDDDKEQASMYIKLRTDQDGSITTSVSVESKHIPKSERSRALQESRQKLKMNLSFGSPWFSTRDNTFKWGLTLNVNHVEITPVENDIPPVVLEELDAGELHFNVAKNSGSRKYPSTYLQRKVKGDNCTLQVVTGRLRKRRIANRYQEEGSAYKRPERLVVDLPEDSGDYMALQELEAYATEYLSKNSEKIFGESKTTEDLKESCYSMIREYTNDAGIRSVTMEATIHKSKDHSAVLTKVFRADQDNHLQHPMVALDHPDHSAIITMDVPSIWVNDAGRWGINLIADSIRLYDESVNVSLDDVDPDLITTGKKLNEYSVGIRYNGNMFQSELHRMRCNKVLENESSYRMHYAISLAVGDKYNDLQEHLIQHAVKSWESWHGVALSEDEVRSRFVPFVNSTYESIKVDLPVRDNCFMTELRDENGQIAPDVHGSLSDRNAYLTGEIKFDKFWFKNDRDTGTPGVSFGVTISAKRLNITEHQAGDLDGSPQYEKAAPVENALGSEWCGDDEDCA